MKIPLLTCLLFWRPNITQHKSSFFYLGQVPGIAQKTARNRRCQGVASMQSGKFLPRKHIMIHYVAGWTLDRATVRWYGLLHEVKHSLRSHRLPTAHDGNISTNKNHISVAQIHNQGIYAAFGKHLMTSILIYSDVSKVCRTFKGFPMKVCELKSNLHCITN